MPEIQLIWGKDKLTLGHIEFELLKGSSVKGVQQKVGVIHQELKKLILSLVVLAGVMKLNQIVQEEYLEKRHLVDPSRLLTFLKLTKVELVTKLMEKCLEK